MPYLEQLNLQNNYIHQEKTLRSSFPFYPYDDKIEKKKHGERLLWCNQPVAHD